MVSTNNSVARARTKTASWLARVTSGSAFTSAFTLASGRRAKRAGPGHCCPAPASSPGPAGSEPAAAHRAPRPAPRPPPRPAPAPQVMV